MGVTVAGRASGEASKIVTGKQVGLFQLMLKKVSSGCVRAMVSSGA